MRTSTRRTAHPKATRVDAKRASHRRPDGLARAVHQVAALIRSATVGEHSSVVDRDAGASFRPLRELLQAPRAPLDTLQLRDVTAALLMQYALCPGISPPLLMACARVFRVAREAPDRDLLRPLVCGLLAMEQAGHRMGPASGRIDTLVECLCHADRPVQALREADLARERHVNPAHLGRCLKARTGLSFRDYCSAIALRSALPLIVDTERPLKWIAEETGFGAAGTRQLARGVHRAFGLAPGALRRLVQRLRAGQPWATSCTPTQVLS